MAGHLASHCRLTFQGWLGQFAKIGRVDIRADIQEMSTGLLGLNIIQLLETSHISRHQHMLLTVPSGSCYGNYAKCSHV